jgi:dTDP-4-dehydrorhamnose reductase
MLGHKLVQVLSERFDVRVTLRSEFERYKHLNLFDEKKTLEKIDVSDFEKIEGIVKNLKPETVINAAGVIKQLPSAGNVINTLEINSIFPQKMAVIANKLDFRFVNISTDCVFDGKKGFYSETDISDATDLYGRSKSFGETVGENCLTLRTSIIGREIETAHSLVEWFISNRGGKVKGFRKAVYTGFPTVILADIIGNLIENFPNLQGLYHVSSEPINKFDLLNLVNKFYGLEIEIEPDDDFVIDRSLNSEKFRRQTDFQPKSWEEMIKIMASDATPYDFWKSRSRSA